LSIKFGLQPSFVSNHFRLALGDPPGILPSGIGIVCVPLEPLAKGGVQVLRLF
jgi:hypothetical protein